MLALTIGGVVCIASAIAGATSQDLKTGYLVGATPYWQQVALVIGVMVSSFAIGGTLILMNIGLAQYKPVQIALDIDHLQPGVDVQERGYTYNGKTYTLVNALGSHEVPDGKYLYDPGTREIEVQWVQGIGSDQAAAPQARLMATVISGILNQRLPWRLVFLGVFLGDRGGVAGRAFAAVRSWLLSFDRHHDGDVRRRPGALAGRAGPGEKERRGKRSEPGLAVRQRIDRSRRRLRPASDRAESASGSRAEQARAALAGVRCCIYLGRRKCSR